MVERPPLRPQVPQAQKNQGVTTVPLHSIPMEGEVEGCGCGVAKQDSPTFIGWAVVGCSSPPEHPKGPYMGSALGAGPLLQAELRWLSSLCLSTPSSDPTNTPQSASSGPQASSGGPLLASPDLVLPAAQTLLQDTLASPQQEGPLVSAGGSDVAPRPLPPPAVGLATGGPDPLLSDCIELVRRTILNARAPSTRKQYENRWKLFSDWCQG